MIEFRAECCYVWMLCVVLFGDCDCLVDVCGAIVVCDFVMLIVIVCALSRRAVVPCLLLCVGVIVMCV